MEQTNNSEKLYAFVEAAKAKGVPDDALAGILREQGWPAKHVYAAIGRYYETLTGLPVPVRGAGAGEAARDAFLYLLAFSTLGTWTFALGALMFDLIERWYPDPVMRRPPPSSYSLSNEMASIIVAFPIFLGVMRFIVREVEAHPEKLESGVRKWLTYIALLIAAGTVIGDLITFLTYLLQGEITIRFVLKVITVLVIAGGVFWYYLGSLRKGAGHDETQ